jgi:hypothetical protein
MTRRTWHWVAAVVGVLALAVGASFTVVRFEVSGTATCPSGMAPAGAYVHGVGYDDGFAQWQTDEKDPYTLTFTHKVAWPWLGWTVDVGCGQVHGAPREWLTNNTSRTIRTTSVRLNCTDVPPPPYPTQRRGVCGTIR